MPHTDLRWVSLSEACLAGTGVIQITVHPWTMTLTSTHVSVGCMRLRHEDVERGLDTVLADFERYEAWFEQYLTLYHVAREVLKMQQEAADE